MHVLPQPVHGGAGQTEGQLQVLLGELQGPDACVQSGPWGKSESHQTALSARTLSATLPVDFENSCFRCSHPRSYYLGRPF